MVIGSPITIRHNRLYGWHGSLIQRASSSGMLEMVRSSAQRKAFLWTGTASKRMKFSNFTVVGGTVVTVAILIKLRSFRINTIACFYASKARSRKKTGLKKPATVWSPCGHAILKKLLRAAPNERPSANRRCWATVKPFYITTYARCTRTSISIANIRSVIRQKFTSVPKGVHPSTFTPLTV